MSAKKHPLETEFDRITNRPPVVQRKTADVIDEVMEHEGMLKLFHLLKQNHEYDRILFLHPLDLFGKEGRYQPPHLYYGYCPTRKKGESQISRALRALEVDYQTKASMSLPKIFEQIGIDATDESVGQDIADAIVYLIVSLFRCSPQLLSLVKAKRFDYPLLRKTMKNYKDVIDDGRIAELLKSVFGEEPSDPALIALINRLILIFVPLMKRYPIEFLGATKLSQTEVTVAYHQTALTFLDSLLDMTSSDFEMYTRLMDDLYLFGLIDNTNTISWCESCSKEKISYTEYHGRKAPSSLLKQKCRECKGIESFSCVFTVDPLFLDGIFSRDHLLGVYLAWRLRDANLNPLTEEFAEDRELDILVGDILIECKTYRLGGRDETPRHNLTDSLSQMQKQIDAMKDEGKTISRAALVCNQTKIRDEIENMSGVLKSLIDQYEIKIVTPEDFDQFLESLE